MLKKGSYLDGRNKYQETLFSIAEENDNLMMLEKLKFFQNSLLVKQNIQKNPLRYAVINKDYEKLTQYLKQGIEDKKDEFHLTSYDYANLEKNKKYLKAIANKYYDNRN